MKVANYTFKSQNGKTEIFCVVTLKNDGKISISMPYGTYGVCAAYKGQARELGKQIVASDFTHSAITRLVVTASQELNLVTVLTDKTQELKAAYFQKVREYASAQFGRMQKVAAYEVTPENTKKVALAISIVAAGEQALTAKELKHAELHYTASIEKLAARLNSKGITPADMEILTAWVGVNLHITIKHGAGITQAWTIVASGMIQRPHYRYLVK